MTGLREKLREPAIALRQVFRNPDLRRINLAFAGSIIGDWAFGLVIALYAFDKGGATALGVFGVVRYVAMAVLAPLLSTLADRYRRKRVMIGADVVSRRARRHRRSARRDRRARARGVRVGDGDDRARDRVPSRPGRVAARHSRRILRSSPPPTSRRAPSRASGSSPVPRSPGCCWRSRTNRP